MDVWIGQLMSRLNGRRIGVAIEQKHGAVVWMLLKYECVEIYPVHPQAAGQFRQALYPSGSKSDPADGELLLDLLVHHRDRLRPLQQDDEPTRRLLMLVEQRRHWVEEKKRHGNRLSARLKVYFPQVLTWFDDIGAAPVLDLLARWPKLERLQKAQRKTLETFLRQHRRTAEEAAAWAKQVSEAVPAVQDSVLVDCYVLEVTALVALLKQMQTSIKEFDSAIAETSRRHPCWAIAQSLPGAGPVMAPRLLAAMGNGKRYQNAHEMQCASGIAPVTVASGRTRIIQFRRACPKFLRQTFHEWAQHSMKSCRWARVYYDQLRASRQAPPCRASRFGVQVATYSVPLLERRSHVRRIKIRRQPQEEELSSRYVASRMRMCTRCGSLDRLCEKSGLQGLDFQTQKSK